MARACALLKFTGAGEPSGTVIDAYPAPFEPAVLTVSRADINALLGVAVPADDVEQILRGLGFVVRPLGGWHAAAPESAVSMAAVGDAWQVDVPGWRPDVSRGVDVIEEVGRHFGFEHLPATFPGVEQAPPPSDARIERDGRVRRALLGAGFSEAVTFAFIDRAAAAPFLDGDEPLELANPLSEKFTTLRPSLIPGLIDAVSYNRRHGRRDVRLFEIGTRFGSRGETRAAAVAWTGLATPDHWSGGRRDVDFFDVKGTVEQLGALFAVAPSFEPARAGYLVPGRTAAVLVRGVRVGIVGQLDAAVADAREMPRGDLTYIAEVDLDALSAWQPAWGRRVDPLPRHPSAVRDISILVDDSLSAEAVRGTIRAAAPATLVSVQEFDRFHGKGIPEGKISLALRLTFQAPDRTLTDQEVADAVEGVARVLTETMGAVRR
jgi:phenylalanyl-tRNA synthetase beta chain